MSRTKPWWSVAQPRGEEFATPCAIACLIVAGGAGELILEEHRLLWAGERFPLHWHSYCLVANDEENPCF